MQNNFNEDDKEKVINFLNMVAQKAEFKLSTQEVIEYFKLLAHMQQIIIPKINDHILEVVKVIEPEKPKRTRSKK